MSLLRFGPEETCAVVNPGISKCWPGNRASLVCPSFPCVPQPNVFHSCNRILMAGSRVFQKNWTSMFWGSCFTSASVTWGMYTSVWCVSWCHTVCGCDLSNLRTSLWQTWVYSRCSASMSLTWILSLSSFRLHLESLRMQVFVVLFYHWHLFQQLFPVSKCHKQKDTEINFVNCPKSPFYFSSILEIQY